MQTIPGVQIRMGITIEKAELLRRLTSTTSSHGEIVQSSPMPIGIFRDSARGATTGKHERNVDMKTEPRCECGSDKVGVPHSKWCPKHPENHPVAIVQAEGQWCAETGFNDVFEAADWWRKSDLTLDKTLREFLSMNGLDIPSSVHRQLVEDYATAQRLARGPGKYDPMDVNRGEQRARSEARLSLEAYDQSTLFGYDWLNASGCGEDGAEVYLEYREKQKRLALVGESAEEVTPLAELGEEARDALEKSREQERKYNEDLAKTVGIPAETMAESANPEAEGITRYRVRVSGEVLCQWLSSGTKPEVEVRYGLPEGARFAGCERDLHGVSLFFDVAGGQLGFQTVTMT